MLDFCYWKQTNLEQFLFSTFESSSFSIIQIAVLTFFIAAYNYSYSAINIENKREKYIRTECDISNDELFTMLDAIDCGEESDVDSILNDPNTEFVSDKPIMKIVYDTYDILVLETNVQVASELALPQQQDCKVLQKK